MNPRILAIVVGLAVSGLTPSVARADCEAIMPTSSVSAGMTGTGWTVASGRTQQSFSVEVLGVLEDAVAPGRDLIIVQASSPTIDAVGIWAGMSGSPVYVSGELMGVVAYGFAAGATTIAGLTPAEDMDALLTLPSRAAGRGLRSAPRSVPLSASLAREVARRTGRSLASTFAGLKPLSIPLSVSGVSPGGLASLTKRLQGGSSTFIPYAGTSASREIAALPPTIAAGDNFASVVSYGDVTISAIGTTSYVCGGQALAFGHPVLFQGDLQWGANAADAITVVPDAVLVPFKLAQVAETVGTVDQDRLAGSRAQLGTAPTAIPVDALVTSADTGRSRAGHSEVVDGDWASQVLFYGLGGNIYSVFDSQGGGTATLWWVFDGTRADGSPWHLSRGNRYAPGFALADETAFALATQLDALLFASSELVDVTSVSVEAKVEKAIRAYTIRKLTVSKNGGPYRARSTVAVKRGTRLWVKVTLRPVEPGPDEVVLLRFRIPLNGPTLGRLVVGGPDSEPGFPGGEGEGEEGESDEPPSFDEVLAELQKMQRNDVLQGRLLLGFDEHQRQQRNQRLTSVVIGSKSIQLIPAGGKPGKSFPGFARSADR
jgi:hypothetical protein